MSSGRIVQIIGAVIDVEFPRDQVPSVYDALIVDARGLRLKFSSSWATALCVPLPWVPLRA